MIGKTHIAIGLLAATFVPISGASGTVLHWPGFNSLFPFVVSLTAVVAGSLAPDIDQPGSKITQIAGPFGKNRIMAMLGGAMAIYFSGKTKSVIGSVELSTILIVIGISLLIMAFVRHRGVTHSLIGVAIAGLIVSAIQNTGGYQQYVGIPIIMPFLVGYTSHLLADFVAGGIPPLYPFVEKRIKPPISIETGSIFDGLIGVMAFLGTAVRMFGN